MRKFASKPGRTRAEFAEKFKFGDYPDETVRKAWTNCLKGLKA